MRFSDRVDSRNFAAAKEPKVYTITSEAAFSTTVEHLTDASRFLCIKPVPLSYSDPPYFKTLMASLLDEIALLETSLSAFIEAVGEISNEVVTASSTSMSYRLRFEDGFTLLARTSNELEFSEVLGGETFYDLMFTMRSIRNTIQNTILQLDTGVISFVDQECAITKASDFYVLRCPDNNFVSASQILLVPEPFIFDGVMVEPKFRHYVSSDIFCFGYLGLDDPFKYLLPLACCDEVINHKSPISCPLLPVYNAPAMFSSDIATIVANPSEEDVTVTCHSKKPQTPVESSFSAVTNCALQIGVISKPGEGTYVASSLKFVADKNIMEMVTQLVSMELFYIIVGFGVFFIILSLVVRPFIDGIITLKDCLQSKVSGDPSAPPIMTGFTLASNKSDAPSPV